MEQLAGGGDLQDAAAEKLGDVEVAVAVELQAVGAGPPAVHFILDEGVEQREVRAVAQRDGGATRFVPAFPTSLVGVAIEDAGN